MAAKEVTCVRLDAALAEALDVAASEAHVTRSAIMRRAIERAARPFLSPADNASRSEAWEKLTTARARADR